MKGRTSTALATAMLLTACGGGTAPPPLAQSGPPSDPVAPPPAPQGETIYRGPAIVDVGWIQETGEILVTRPESGGVIVMVGAAPVGGHVVARGSLQFRDLSAPAVASYGASDVTSDSWFEAMDSGDLYRWFPGGGGLSLRISDATPGALHGTLHVSMKFAHIDATF